MPRLFKRISRERKLPKFIVVIGGVMSGVGKGVTTASVGKMLQARGLKVTAIKIDPYINYDAGTLRPTEHGEVWVTEDGGEIDQDLGNYERFFGIDIPRKNNITTGQIYKTVIDKERKGEYLGKTVQFIPHIPDEIQKRILDVASEDLDVVLIEVGGTVGDYENLPYLFALKSLEREIGHENLVFILITYLPTPSHIDEMKTKPTQQAVRMLSEHGIFPDFIVCRAKTPLDEPRKKKIETYANIEYEHVISEPDIDTIYRIPLDLEKEGLGEKLIERLKLKVDHKPKWKEWEDLVDKIISPKKEIRIALVGKYVDIGDFALTDSYVSVNQALIHAGAAHNCKVKIDWIDSKNLEKDAKKVDELKNYDGIIVPGGFGSSGVEGKILAAKVARENKIPYLGLCYGMQLAIIEFCRNVLGWKDANTTEVNPNTAYPVIDIIDSQKSLMKNSEYGGTMRLGSYVAVVDPDSQIAQIYKECNRDKADKIRFKELEKDPAQSFRIGKLEKGMLLLERHRHRFEVNPKYIEQIEKAGLRFSGYHEREDGTKLMEFIEMPSHGAFFGTQGHPEFKSRLGDPAPLFYGFVKAALKLKGL